MKILRKIKLWYQGKHIDNDPDSEVLLIGFYDRHWTAVIARSVLGFVKREYKWLIGTLLLILGLVISASQ